MIANSTAVIANRAAVIANRAAVIADRAVVLASRAAVIKQQQVGTQHEVKTEKVRGMARAGPVAFCMLS